MGIQIFMAKNHNHYFGLVHRLRVEW